MGASFLDHSQWVRLWLLYVCLLMNIIDVKSEVLSDIDVYYAGQVEEPGDSGV